MGDATGVFPIALGLIVFVFTLSFILTMPSFFETTVETPLDVTGKLVDNPATLLGSNYICWNPQAGYSIDPTNESIIINNYFTGGQTIYGPSSSYLSYQDINADKHYIDARIIRNNTGQGYYSVAHGIDYGLYHDFIALDGVSLDLGWRIAMFWGTWSFDTIESHHESGTNYSVTPVGLYNISMLLVVNGTATDDTFFHDQLYDNNYTLYIVQNPEIDYTDFFTIMVWIITFNTSWMPDAPIIAILISAVVDIAISLCVLFVAIGMIP